MDKTLAGIFVYFFVLVSLSSAELYTKFNDEKNGDLIIKSAGFQALQPNPALKKCANEVLKEPTSVALRVNELTGQCEKLDTIWLHHPLIKTGYAYAKRVSYRENFQPPGKQTRAARLYLGFGDRYSLYSKRPNPAISDVQKIKTWFLENGEDRLVEVDQLLEWYEPGIFNEGSRLDLFISITKPHRFMHFVVQLESGLGNYKTEILFQPGGNTIRFVETKEYETAQVLEWDFNDPWSSAFGSTEVFKISLLVSADAIAMLVEDKTLCSFNITEFLPPNRVEFGIDEESVIKATTQVFIHGIQYLGM